MALLLAAVSGCSAGRLGIAQPRVSAGDADDVVTSLPSPAQSVSLSIDPCSLLTADDLAGAGKFESRYEEQGSARSCFWQKDFNGENDTFTFILSVRDSQGIDVLNDIGGGVVKEDVNKRPATSTEDPESGDCVLALKLDINARIDVTVLGEEGRNDSCEVAQGISRIFEPRLPEIP
ncbi:DUF3558 family protein [Saccharomonospora xinjiangensis]|uniref:DUF3558 family protein n=1 Tax=Saccharomonospora xinjiangensis TaxID=75294 RepID=UPI00350FE8F0